MWFEAAGASGAAKAEGAVIATDVLYFSPVNAGYELETTDIINIVYSSL
jgi:hypothetical protein